VLWNEKGTLIVYTAESPAGAMVKLIAYYKDVHTLETRAYFRLGTDEELILGLVRTPYPTIGARSPARLPSKRSVLFSIKKPHPWACACRRC